MNSNLEIGFQNVSVENLKFIREKFDKALNGFIDKLETMRIPCYDNVLRWDEVVPYTIDKFNPFYFIEGLECATNIDINPHYNEGRLTHVDFDSYGIWDEFEEEYTWWDDIHWSIKLRPEQIEKIEANVSKRKEEHETSVDAFFKIEECLIDGHNALRCESADMIVEGYLGYPTYNIAFTTKGDGKVVISSDEGKNHFEYNQVEVMPHRQLWEGLYERYLRENGKL